MGVCCIVFDIDGMLFEFFLNFFAFYAIYILKKNVVSKNNFGGGGGVSNCFFFFYKNTSLLFHFAFYAIFNIKKI